MLDKRNRKIAGVCAGFARHLDADVTLVRLLWLVVAFATGFGFLAYVVAWIVLPADWSGYYQYPAAPPPPRPVPQA